MAHNHQPCKRIGDKIIGTRYTFMIPLKDGGQETVTLTPMGWATDYWRKSGLFGNKIKEMGSNMCFSMLDSNPSKLMKIINEGGFVLCDSGKGINGHQIIVDKITCMSEQCEVVMNITREEFSVGDY